MDQKKTRKKKSEKHALNGLKAFKMGMIHNEAKAFMYVDAFKD